MNKKSFTLIEILIVMTIVAFVFTVILAFYFKMIDIKIQVESKQSLIKNSYWLLERINILMKDYTIDYEEYFNRSIVWCDWSWWDSFSWTGNNWVWNDWYCNRFTHYWNSKLQSYNNNTILDWWMFSCSSTINENSPNHVLVEDSNNKIINWGWCWRNNAVWEGKTMSFGEYKEQFWDAKDDTDGTWGILWDDDDIDIWKGPIAIQDINNMKEIYLISKDNKKRILLRRALVSTWDWDHNWSVDSDIDKLYTLQILKLKWFDAWNKHDFNAFSNVWLYDGNIDTWACDYWEWFMCKWNDVNWWYTNYKLPNSSDDWRINLFWNDITIVWWDLRVLPVKNPNLSWSEENLQINPYIQVHIKTKLYGQPWSWKISPWILDNYEIDLQTTFNIKSNY